MKFIPRPLESYGICGAEFQMNGKSVDSNPHEKNSIAWLEWQIFYLEEHLNLEKIIQSECGNDHEIELITEKNDNLYAEIEDLKLRVYLLNSDIRKALPSIDKVVETINIPTDDWHGRCYEIAENIHKSKVLIALENQFGALFLRYGQYHGHVDKKSHFRGRSPCRHAWLESFNGFVIDPTQWVFSNDEPQISVSSIDDYDLGGIRLTLDITPTKKRPPIVSRDQLDKTPLDISSLSAYDISIIANLLRQPRLNKHKTLQTKETIWLCSVPMEWLGEATPGFYQKMIESGNSAFLPIDARQYVSDWTEQHQQALKESNSIRMV